MTTVLQKYPPSILHNLESLTHDQNVSACLIAAAVDSVDPDWAAPLAGRGKQR